MRRLAVITLFIAALCATNSRASLDASSTVFIILMENHNWSSINGNTTDAPYINSLLPMASYCDQYYNPPGIHPSEPNYLWLEAGTNFGILNDNSVASNHQSTTNHFVTQLKNAGISWKTYQEDIAGTTCTTTNSGNYAFRHNPFVFFDDVTSPNCATTHPCCTDVMRPFTELAADLGNNAVPHYVFITPNVCNDMHDSCAPTNNPVKQGDLWLQNNLPMILSSAAYQNGLVIITWDEGVGGDGPIGCIVLSPLAKGGAYHNSLHYTHSTTLRMLQKIFGVSPFLGVAASGNDLSDLFVAGAIPNPDLPPAVTTTSASNVGSGSAVLGGSVNPNGDVTSTWFEYGLTTSYGSDTLSHSPASDNAESYSTWAYGSSGGTGFGPAHYLEGSGGGIYLDTSARRIDGAKSFGVFAGGGPGNTEGMDRSINFPPSPASLTLSVRFDVDNSVVFSGFNL